MVVLLPSKISNIFLNVYRLLPCALILSETLALYKSFTYLLTYLLTIYTYLRY